MSGIDDPIEAVKQQYPDQSSDPVEVLLDVVAESHPFAGMANAIRSFFSKKEASERVKALLDALEWYIREHERRLNSLERKAHELSAKMNSSEFIETVLVSVNESLRTARVERIVRFARVLGHELVYGDKVKTSEDAATYIRTLSELGEKDLRVLATLNQFQANLDLEYLASAGVPVIVEPMRQTVNAAKARGISREDLYARCSRLAGYGLVLQIDKSRFNVSPTESVFLLTGSGKKLIAILND